MSQIAHPVEQEELMAYLDGEIPVKRAAAVATHIEECADCQAVARELRSLAEQLAAWQVKPAPASLAERVIAALHARPKEGHATPKRRLLPGWVWAFAAGSAGLLLLLAVSIPNLLKSRMAVERGIRSAVIYTNDGGYGGGGNRALGEAPPRAQEASAQPAGPMIVRTASLTLVTKDFEKTRADVERIVRQHGGYSAQLSASGQSGMGRALTATFRVPADQLDSTLSELKKLGRVEQELQGGEEVTRQYVDLGARLSNARHTEQRLTEVLRLRTGKVADVLQVEREIARVREEIERMDAERKNLENQVRYATLKVTLSEEYRAQLEVTPPTTGTRLRNATVEGYGSAVESAVGLVLFLLSYGPSILFWSLILFWPARFAWRRVRARSS